MAIWRVLQSLPAIEFDRGAGGIRAERCLRGASRRSLEWTEKGRRRWRGYPKESVGALCKLFREGLAPSGERAFERSVCEELTPSSEGVLGMWAYGPTDLLHAGP